MLCLRKNLVVLWFVSCNIFLSKSFLSEIKRCKSRTLICFTLQRFCWLFTEEMSRVTIIGCARYVGNNLASAIWVEGICVRKYKRNISFYGHKWRARSCISGSYGFHHGGTNGRHRYDAATSSSLFIDMIHTLCPDRRRPSVAHPAGNRNENVATLMEVMVHGREGGLKKYYSTLVPPNEIKGIRWGNVRRTWPFNFFNLLYLWRISIFQIRSCRKKPFISGITVNYLIRRGFSSEKVREQMFKSQRGRFFCITRYSNKNKHFEST